MLISNRVKPNFWEEESELISLIPQSIGKEGLRHHYYMHAKYKRQIEPLLQDLSLAPEKDLSPATRSDEEETRPIS